MRILHYEIQLPTGNNHHYACIYNYFQRIAFPVTYSKPQYSINQKYSSNNYVSIPRKQRSVDLYKAINSISIKHQLQLKNWHLSYQILYKTMKSTSTSLTFYLMTGILPICHKTYANIYFILFYFFFFPSENTI